MILIRITFLLVKGIIFFEGTKNQEPILLIVFPFLTSCSQAHTSSHHITSKGTPMILCVSLFVLNPG